MWRWVLAILVAWACSGTPAFAAEASSTTETALPPSWIIDQDSDGLPDAWESLIFKTDPLKKDTDKDGFSDLEEIQNAHDPRSKKTNVVFGDADHDGLDDRLEFLFGTDPLKPDSDEDGFADGEEIKKGFSPTSTSATPLQKGIRITLSKQLMQQQLGGVTLAQYRVSTGKPGMTTPVGQYTVLEKNPKAWSRAAKLWMPYWMKFTNRGHGIHELPEWPGGKKEGMDHLGRPVSHGCVRLGIGPAKAMYDWAPVGTPIQIVR